jgi:hypothetical protein
LQRFKSSEQAQESSPLTHSSTATSIPADINFRAIRSDAFTIWDHVRPNRMIVGSASPPRSRPGEVKVTMPVGMFSRPPPKSTQLERPNGACQCDILRSRRFTAISSRLDPKDLPEVIRTYQACVATTIAKVDGFIAHYVGVLAVAPRSARHP